ncbi:MAG: 30S ribosomal protein S16 [Candidatus Bipolaricaulota bacterium]|nr:30S ribosomal protein S16 [Candidatus Bipolaricaulota bacterium]MDW8126900.1 30S ribosomal protein S16 [Candidatus Bipolaricaulota bacterium]
MAVKIRLMRVGKKKQPSYRIVVVDEAEKLDGAVIQVIGHYHPLSKADELTVDVERALGWLKKGAQPTEAAKRLLSRAGVMKLWHEERFGHPSAPGAQSVPS